jgi:hypothetical protein
MPFVSTIKTSDSELQVHDPLTLDRLISGPEESPSKVLFLYGPNEAEMSLTYMDPHGYYVSNQQRGTSEAIAMDKSLPDGQIEVIIADDLQTVPRSILLREELAIPIVHEFFWNGQRFGLVSWVNPFEVIE